ncbi:MAG: AMP-binding protein, partial [Candidatus Eremiobacteraeota bacterium]|nr:AMP-binding protein [Candidatus Eremiobacteraeota bacterium]
MNVALWADEHLEKYGDYDALITGEGRWSSGELHRRSCCVAGGLVGGGLSPGTRVIVCLPASDRLIVAFNAVLRAGGVAVVVNSDTPPDLLSRVVRESAARLVLTDIDEWEHAPPLVRPVERIGSDPAQIVLTSGSTAEPKGVLWSHSTVQARYLRFADTRPATARPRRALCALPFSSAFGTQYLYLRMLQKMQLVLPESLQPASVISALQEHRVQTTMLVPSLCEALLQQPTADLSSLKSVLVGGSFVSPGLIRRFEERFGVRITPVYGLTELGPVAFDGKVREDLEIRIAESGEVEVRAGASRAEYLGHGSDEEWFSTGDLGAIGEDGRLHLHGRLKNRIVQAGVTISPEEIEEALRALKGVRDCAVVGVPEPFLGEEVVAFVVGDGISSQEVHRHCKKGLDRLRRPTRVVFCEEIPRTEVGKVKRPELQKRAAQGESDSALSLALASLSREERRSRLKELVREQIEGVQLDSIERVSLAHRLSDLFGKRLPSTVAFNHPPVEALAEHLNTLFEEPRGTSGVSSCAPNDHAIAIVGIGCRLPRTDSPEEFWDLLCQGVDFTDKVERWELRQGPEGSVTDRAAFTDIEMFDADFFGLSEREARATDPQHRMVLESAWHALEHAGYNPRTLSGSRCGVFLGLSGTSYRSADALGTSPSVGAGRVAHF